MRNKMLILVVVCSFFLLLGSFNGVVQAQNNNTLETNPGFGLGLTFLDLDELNEQMEEEGSPTFENGLLTLNFSNRYKVASDWYMGNSSLTSFAKSTAGDKTSYLSFAYIGLNGGKEREIQPNVSLKAGAGAGLGMLSLYISHQEPEDFGDLVGNPQDTMMIKYYFMLSPELSLEYKINNNSSLQLSCNYLYGLSGKNWHHYYENKIEGPLSSLQGTSVTLNYGYTF